MCFILLFLYVTGIDTDGIGVATSDSPEGPFQIIGNDGKHFNSGEVDEKFNRTYFIQDHHRIK